MAKKILFVPLCYCLASSTLIKANLVTHLLPGLYVHCYPVTCQAGFQASFCKLDGTSDYCHSCPFGSTQEKIVDTSTLRSQNDVPKCSRIDIACLEPETRSVVENGIIARCECDLSNGYIGQDPLCMKVNSCVPGEELEKSSGRCLPCPKGSYKNTAGYEFCQPWISCETIGRETLKEGNATSDTICGKRLQTTRTTPRLHLTTNKRFAPLKCATGDCLSKAGQTESKDVMNRTRTVENQHITHQHHSKECGLGSQQYAVIIVIMVFMLIIMWVCFSLVFLRLPRTHWKGCRLSTRKEKDVEMCLQQGIQKQNEVLKHADKTGRRLSTRQEKDAEMCLKPGIQEENDVLKHADKTAPEKWTAIDGLDQPATFYPPINDQPAEPTAPELSMQGSLQPLIHVPINYYKSDSQNDDFKVNIYVPKGNYN